jgi:predicted Zn finger-like uncharacterized protein
LESREQRQEIQPHELKVPERREPVAFAEATRVDERFGRPSFASISRNLDGADIKTSTFVFIISGGDPCHCGAAEGMAGLWVRVPNTIGSYWSRSCARDVIPMQLPISLSCPHCDARLKIKDESLLGSTVKCPKCRERFIAEEPLEVVDKPELDDDEFEDDRPLPSLASSRRTAKRAQPNSAGTKTFRPPTNRGSGSGRQTKQRRLLIALAGGAIAALACLLVAGVLLLRGRSETPARFEPPEKYVPIRAGAIPLTGTIPEGWKQQYGGGVGAVPIRASFSDGGSISIEIRQTVGISLMISQVIAKKNPQPPSLKRLHSHHLSMTRQDFAQFDDDSSRPIETEGFPEACVSTFSAKEPGIFGREVKGCRATLRGAKRQFNIVCKCPPAQFDDVLPVFEKIIASLGTPEKK